MLFYLLHVKLEAFIHHHQKLDYFLKIAYDDVNLFRHAFAEVVHKLLQLKFVVGSDDDQWGVTNLLADTNNFHVAVLVVVHDCLKLKDFYEKQGNVYKPFSTSAVLLQQSAMYSSTTSNDQVNFVRPGDIFLSTAVIKGLNNSLSSSDKLEITLL